MPYIWPGSGGGGATTNIDAGARSLIAQLLATPGTTPDVQPGDGITADELQWQNQTGAAIPIPNPATSANMQTAGFTDVTAGGATDSLNTAGPWTGTANAGDKFGLDPATGNRYYVDNAGDWQVVASSIDLNTTRVVIAGNAPAANTIPASISGQTRDDGDYELQNYDDFRVVYRFNTPAAATEIERESLIDSPAISVKHISAVEPLVPYTDYQITTTGLTPSGTYTDHRGDTQNMVDFPVVNGASTDDVIYVTGRGAGFIHINLTGSFGADNPAVNEIDRMVKLSWDGAKWIVST